MSGLRLLAVLALALAAVAARFALGAHHELERGDHFRQSGDLDEAIVHYRRAARGYVPGSPYHVRALDRLAEIASGAEQARQPELELAAQRAIRSALMSTRGVYIPERDRLRRADERVAARMAQEPASAADADKSGPARQREYLAMLQADPGPSVSWSVGLLLGFGAWVGATFVVTHRGSDAENRAVPRALRRWAAWVALGFGLFALGLSLA